jgi:aspartate racemase
MRMLGLIGGTGWISTVEYYRLINEEIGRRLGGLEAARLLLYSINYADIDRCNQRQDRAGVLALLREAARVLEQGGAEGLVLCANTLHTFVPELQPHLRCPIVHIAAATAAAVRRRGLARVGLLGTRYTMEEDFIRGPLEAAGLRVDVPDADDRTFIHTAIREELLRGLFAGATKSRFLRIMDGLARRGAEGVILGCTEIPLLIKPADTPLPLFDTLVLHARAAAEFALADRRLEN